ncbi:MAE_28990/MAE_18760 family HEPN-like nuclease [Epilithonimonas hominis]|uniref:MAE_28990/MAE_18760 family HEPN-like nuclease n=1 Tax=Epilithonimonas hominis TaxID=420404 RepID=UPI000EBB5E63|nr:MAE_28990/MAE_18760 family HEPN-like nuclease [Epilithonimonas hominis]HAP96084.1 hypothetical protein [Chryseobacterium sp.]
MTNTKQILTDRKNEIGNYVQHLKTTQNTISGDLFKILKSNTILMLYNIVEAVISSAIEDIRHSIHNDPTTSFDDLKEEIKIQIIKDLRVNINAKDFINISSNLSTDIIKNSFKKEKISNGNISRKVVRDLSEIYGFQVQGSDYSKTKDGVVINDIKSKRNDLAHGTFSFAEIGRDYSYQDVEDLSNCTINFLEYIIGNIEVYLANKGYKAVI